jgi:M6 family metalloprotease-like protein
MSRSRCSRASERTEIPNESVGHTSTGLHRAHRWFAAALLFAIACDSPTGPSRDFDIDRFPYVVSVNGVRHFGTTRLLVIPARFVDGAAPPLTSAEIQAQLFGGAGGGPVTQSYLLASGGAFVLRGHVTSWVTTSVAQSTIFTGGTETYLKDALLAVEDEVDFGLYDNDGPDGLPNSGDDDGVVDGGVAILNSETNRYCNGGTGLGYHPFAARGRILTADRSVNGNVIEVQGFTVMSVTGCGGRNVGAHVLAHELGHLFFSLPDNYHQLGGAGEVWATRRWVAGCWELMAAGAWGCGTGAPTLDYRFNTLGAWPRTILGWSTPVLVNPEVDQTYELRPLGRGGTVLRVPITSDHEYLLIEYREAQPGDEKIPGNGVVMFHVSETLPIFPQTLTSPYRMSLIEADDDSAMFRTELQGGNRGTAGDAFGITRTSFRPGEHSRARAVDGSPLPFQITEITVDAAGRRATLRISP